MTYNVFGVTLNPAQPNPTRRFKFQPYDAELKFRDDLSNGS